MSAAAAAVAAAVAVATFWTDGTSQADKARPIRMSQVRVVDIDGRASLKATFTGGSDSAVVERISLVQYYSVGSITDDVIELDGCGGRDFEVMVLSDAELVDEAAGTYAIDQTIATENGDATSQIYGQNESLLDCYERLYIDTHPDLPVDAEASSEFAFALDESLTFDQRYTTTVDGVSSVRPQQFEYYRQLIPSMQDPEYAEYFSTFGIRVIGIAAHTEGGECISSALQFARRDDTSRPLDVTIAFQSGTLDDWLCSLLPLPVAEGASADPLSPDNGPDETLSSSATTATTAVSLPPSSAEPAPSTPSEGAGTSCGQVADSADTFVYEVVLRAGAVTCDEATAVARTYLTDPTVTHTGSGGFTTIDGFLCGFSGGIDNEGGCSREDPFADFSLVRLQG